MTYMRTLAVLILLGPALVAVPAGSETGKSVVIHVKTVPGDDPGRFFAIARMTVAALGKGHSVTMLFDGEGARVVRLGSWYGGDTSLLDKLDITGKERATLAGDLGLTEASTPSNYGDLMRLLRGKGVSLFVNRDMMRFHEIDEDEFDTVFVPVGPDEMIGIFEGADMYISY